MQVDQSKKRSAPESVTPSKAQKTDAAQTPSTPAEGESNTVYLRNVNYDSNEESIQAAFEQFGEIKEIRINYDKFTNQSRGSAFVEFTASESAQAALEFSGQEIDGKTISVELANPKRAPGTPNTPRGGAPGRPTSAPSKVLFAGNLNYDTTSESLREAFTGAEELSDVRIMYGQDGQSRGFGYVEFGSVESATKALDFNGTDVDGRALKLDYAPEKGQGGGGGGGGFGGGRGGGRGGFGGGRGGRGGFGGDRGGRGGYGGGRGGDRGGRGGFGGRGGRGGRGGDRGGFSGRRTSFNN